MTPYDWYSDDDASKIVRRNAANKFLSAVLDDPEGLGAAVTGMDPDQKKNARDEFAKALNAASGGEALPKDVEVICIDEDTRKRANLVVFVLRKKGDPGEDLWDGRWVAAWAPY